MKPGSAVILLAAAAATGLGMGGSAWGQDPMSARLSAERVSDITAGSYGTDAAASNEGRQFTLEPYGEKYLLRFTSTPENFVLTVDRGVLGAKWLKYDTGATAIRVSVWGGLTLYTHDAPNGMPANRQGDAPAFGIASVSAPDLTAAMHDETSHLSYVQNLPLAFGADPSVIKSDGETRAMAFETLTNTVTGIERFLAAPAARKALTQRIDAVRVTEGAKPTIIIAGRALMVSFVPGEGYDGRASSHAIAHALGKLLQVSTEE
ncbi:MAG TPA: DUF4908 domain-containing protein [Rhizomicrobium sp.]|nr:DUF4908 domain-containing protein [Rhizomicrobium sp.]